ncbi:GSCFA domain-containing protein [Adhaeribacter rhizoryzae]|uniref:GSCFA domain-containing protein n=1 Tax=Adhaeribacter rhizoryzae TaxID=2607907 RepID=A0A5M6DTN9_9BACT|nr:GSCFA domain-containing protein [Adhaeribacter rhizoryzae]KAA5549572.1 GSCFA domain-containing protein [Adhaeribacter rhizoryzae]
MTLFRTEINIKPIEQQLGLNARVLTAGSCFAEVMGNKVAGYKVQSLVNPFGTIFNPVSLFKLLATALQPEPEFTGELLERDGYWYAYDLHSSFTAPSRTLLISRIQTQLVQTQEFLKNTDLLILTLGTAVGYIHKASNTLVANCHKVPQQAFEKKLISTATITNAFAPLYASLQALNPNIKILFTVSPVRHLKETLELNSVSKSILRVACQELSEAFAGVQYFPAYELMLDDLRDYRFYKADMLHPTEVAEDYIWQKFSQAYFNQDFQNFAAKWDKIQQALAHKPFQPESAAHQQVLQKLLGQLQALNQQTDCSAEIAQVKSMLI